MGNNPCENDTLLAFDRLPNMQAIHSWTKEESGFLYQEKQSTMYYFDNLEGDFSKPLISRPMPWNPSQGDSLQFFQSPEY